MINIKIQARFNLVVSTLELLDANLDDALELLTEDGRFLFGDNGGDPDGPAWFPSSPIQEREQGVEEILAKGWGRMVSVRYYEGLDQIAATLKMRGIANLATLAEVNGNDEPGDEEVVEVLQNWGRWAYYTSSETLVISELFLQRLTAP